MQPQGYSHGDRSIQMDLEMTTEQRRAAVLELLGDMPEQQAFEFMRAEFPAWFVEAAQ